MSFDDVSIKQRWLQLGTHIPSMSLFKGFFPSTRNPRGDAQERDERARSGPETAPVKMNLEERMAFRRELLFENVRATLSSYFIDARSYRFKVMRTDKRGHCYVVMLDMQPKFMESEHGQHPRLAEIAAALTKNAQTRYGLVVVGVYWRIDETLAAPVAERAKPAAAAAATAAPSFATSQPGPELTNIEKYERATAEQLAAFEAAWQRDADIQIGDRTYSSDLAPLGDDPPRE